MAKHLHLPLVAASLVLCTALPPVHAGDGFGIGSENLRAVPAAATAQIWILKNEKTHYRVVLDDGGQGVVLSNSKTNGLRDLTMPSDTAGHYSDELLKFDGVRYKIFKSCAIDLQDTEEIKKHPDGQCHVN